VNGYRIAEDDKVIYYGKLHKIVRASENEVEDSLKSKNKLW